MEIKQNQKGFIPVIILLVIVVAMVGFFVYQNAGKPPILKSASVVSQGKSLLSNLLEQPTPTSKPVGMILSAITTKSIDSKTGMGGAETTIFSTKDPVIYVVMKVNKPKKGTNFEYVRYFNDKYVDHKSLKTINIDTDYVSFKWALVNAKSAHLAGDYKVKLYTNGKFEEELSYQVR